MFQTVPLSYWINPAERLVQAALNKWRMRLMKADNTSAIVVLIDPLGPRKLSILKKKREEKMKEVALKKSHDNQVVTELLAAKESLTKSPKKANMKNTVSSHVLQKPKVEEEHKPHAHVKNESHAKVGKSCDKFIVTSMHKSSDSLDESIQLRNSHLISPVSDNKKKPDAKPVSNNGKKPDMKLLPVSPKVKTSPLQTSLNENLCKTGMVTRSSPQKSPEAVKSSVNSLTSSVSNNINAHQTRSHDNTAAKVAHVQQKCLQPSKNTSENVRNSTSNKVHSDIRVKDVENIYSTDVKLGLRNLNLKNSQKPKVGKNLNNSSSSTDGLRSAKKPHSCKSLSTRISLRLRRLRQKTQKIKVKGHSENKGFLVKSGVKRKMDASHSSGTPASKKIRHS